MMRKRAQSESSNEDEGFMPNKVVVENYQKHAKDKETILTPSDIGMSKERPTDYQPRYICGAGLLKYIRDIIKEVTTGGLRMD